MREIKIDQEEWRIRRKLDKCIRMEKFAYSPKAAALWGKRKDATQTELDNHLKSREAEENEKI